MAGRAVTLGGRGNERKQSTQNGDWILWQARGELCTFSNQLPFLLIAIQCPLAGANQSNDEILQVSSLLTRRRKVRTLSAHRPICSRIEL